VGSDLGHGGVSGACVGDEAIVNRLSTVFKRTKVGYIPSNCIPCNVTQVEDQIFWFVIFRSSKDCCPVFKVSPSLFRCAATERRETGQELEEDASKRPVVY
jgi:hypothetical protein